MRIVGCLLIFIFILCKVSAQSTDTSSFISKKGTIDSIVFSIDNNKELLQGIAEGNSKGEEGFDFNIYFYYYKNSKEIIKLEYNQYGDSQTHTVFYYNYQHLLMINEDKSRYYFIDNTLVNVDGISIDPEKSKNLITPELDTKKLMTDVLTKHNFKL